MRRRLAVWLVGSALLAVVVFLVGCAVSESVKPTPEAAHPEFASGTACNASSCHDDYTHEEPYLGACESCHSLDNWKRITYTHKDAEFDNGMHPLVGCVMCHTEGEKLPTGGCVTCHEADHGGWEQCGSCHTAIAWRLLKPKPADHVSLKGDHSELSCQDCHKAPETPKVPRGCVDCHGTNHGGLRNCEDCHTPDNGWTPSDDFDHNDFFQLRGAHTKLDCADCHTSGKFAGTPRVCVGCHGKQHGGLTDCGACHSTSTFKPATFRHSSVFALTGEHADLNCTRCHPDREYARVIGNGSRRCTACHGTQHGGLTECAQCHTTKGFEPSSFVHSSVFPLIGEHDALYDAGQCAQCHPGDAFAVVAGTKCVDCHSDSNPHATSVPTTCQTCHTPLGFDQILTPYEDHPIALGAKHTERDCTLCHTSLVFSDATKACQVCHAAPHVGPTDCYSCHRPTTWAQVVFEHPVIWNFEHTENSGHFSEEFGGYPAGCENCHPGTDSIPNFTEVYCLDCHQ